MSSEDLMDLEKIANDAKESVNQCTNTINKLDGYIGKMMEKATPEQLEQLKKVRTLNAQAIAKARNGDASGIEELLKSFKNGSKNS